MFNKFVLALFQQFERLRKVFEHVTNMRQNKTKKISIEYAIFRFPTFSPKILTEKSLEKSLRCIKNAPN
jgi:hypothetical protein